MKNDAIVVCNFTPKTIEKYRLGMPKKGTLIEIFNSDDKKYGGSGSSNLKDITVKKLTWNNRDYSAEIAIPPLGIAIFKFK